MIVVGIDAVERASVAVGSTVPTALVVAGCCTGAVATDCCGRGAKSAAIKLPNEPPVSWIGTETPVPKNGELSCTNAACESEPFNCGITA